MAKLLQLLQSLAYPKINFNISIPLGKLNV